MDPWPARRALLATLIRLSVKAAPLAASLVIAFTALLPRAAHSQTLQLDPAPPPPALNAESATRRVATLLREELDDLNAHATLHGASNKPDTPEAAVWAARAALRRLAFELLIRAAAATDPEQASASDTLAMQGFRCADSRRRVDVRLERFLQGIGATEVDALTEEPRTLSVRERDRVRRLLLRFAEVAPKALATINYSDIVQIDAGIAVAVGPLVDALAILSGLPTGEEAAGAGLGTGWPTTMALSNAGALAGKAKADPERARSAEADFAVMDPCSDESLASAGAQTREAARSHCAVAGSDDSQPSDRLRAAVALSVMGETAALLSTAERSIVDETAAKLLRGEGSVALAATQTELLHEWHKLTDVTKAGDGRTSQRTELDQAIRLVLFPTQEAVAFADDSAAFARLGRRIIESIELAIIARAHDSSSVLPKEFRPQLKDFLRAYERAEAGAWSRFAEMLADEESLSNPEFVGLVTAQRQAVVDLGRLARAQRIIDAVGGTRPQAVRGLTTRMKTMLRWLLDPTRRSDGIVAYDALALQIELFAPLPFETELRRETPEVIAFTSGEPRKLAEVIDLTRAEWADAWSAGNGNGPAAQRMYRLFRVMRAMEDVTRGNGPEDGDAAAALSRWGGFHVAKAALAPALLDIETMMKLAVAAAVDRDDARLEREITRIERDTPLAQLVGRLAADLRAWLATRPGDAVGALAAMREGPTSDAWGLSLRIRLAAIARYARELDDARRGNRDPDEKALLAYLSRLAGSLLESLGAERSPLPPLADLGAESAVPSGRRRGS